MRWLIALAAIIAPGTACATSLCDSLNAMAASTDSAPDGWKCAKIAGDTVCKGPGGRPQATVFAHLYAVNAEIAACYGVPAVEPAKSADDNQHDFAIQPGITVSTYTQDFGQPDGGIRLRMTFAHRS